jgi:hypothetical protein
MPEGFQAPVQQELRLVLLFGYGSNHTLIEAGRQAVRFDIGDKSVAVFLTDQGFNVLRFGGHGIPVDLRT